MIRLHSILLFLALLCSCKKTSSSGTTTDDDGPPAITAVGTPTGSPVTKTIGSAGGTITSADGKVDLIIPAGSLTGDVPITIQPVTNECPGGIGTAYDLLPNGTKLLIPATFTLNYTDDDVNGTDPLLIDLATQDSLNEWDVNVEKDVDTIGKTISFDIYHFSPRAKVPEYLVAPPLYAITSGNSSLGENEKTTLQVVQVINNKAKSGPKFDRNGDPVLYPLPKSKPVLSSLVKNWRVNGGSQNGSIAPNGNEAEYTAPSSIPKQRTVSVSVTIGATQTSVNRGGKAVNVPQDKTYKLLLHPSDKSFLVKFDVNIPNTNGYYNDMYHDGATLKILVSGNKTAGTGIYPITISLDDIQNQEPTDAKPTNTVGGTTCTWDPDKTGITDIYTAIGWATDTTLNRRFVTLYFTNPYGVTATWTYKFSNGSSSTEPGVTGAGFPNTFLFFINPDNTTEINDPYINSGLKGLLSGSATLIPN